MFIEFHPSHLN
jgi:hypothetical protein